MYSQNELDEAVAAGALSAEAANALRMHIESQRSTPTVDEEQFRLLTGFNDIFVSIAAAILLFAVAWIGHQIGQNMGLAIEGDGPSPTGPLAVAATAWGLALFFTAKRRMALPSILLLLAFVGGVFATAAFGLVLAVGPDSFDNNEVLGGIVAAAAAAIAAGAAWLHWKRFRVPITVAAGAAAVAALVMALIVSALGGVEGQNHDILLGFGLAPRHRHVPVRDVVGRIRPRAHHPPVRRRLLASPAGGADDRAPGLHPARPERRQCDHRRGLRGHPALRRARPDRLGDRPPRACSSRRSPMCSMRSTRCSGSSARSSSMSR